MYGVRRRLVSFRGQFVFRRREPNLEAPTSSRDLLRVFHPRASAHDLQRSGRQVDPRFDRGVVVARDAGDDVRVDLERGVRVKTHREGLLEVRIRAIVHVTAAGPIDERRVVGYTLLSLTDALRECRSACRRCL